MPTITSLTYAEYVRVFVGLRNGEWASFYPELTQTFLYKLKRMLCRPCKSPAAVYNTKNGYAVGMAMLRYNEIKIRPFCETQWRHRKPF